MTRRWALVCAGMGASPQSMVSISLPLMCPSVAAPRISSRRLSPRFQLLFAMAIEGDAMDGLLSEFGEADNKEGLLFQEEALAALMHALTQPQQKGKEISPEDEAWVNSCLVGDAELSETGWSAMRDALLESLTTNTDGSTKEVAEVASPNMASEMMEDIGETHEAWEEEDAPPTIRFEDKYLFDDGEGGDDKFLFEDLPGREEGDAVQLENEKQPLDDDDDDDDDIFKVWDLETPDEEDVLIMQLKKALAQERLGDDDPSSALNQLDLDELIAGIADFKPFSE